MTPNVVVITHTKLAGSKLYYVHMVYDSELEHLCAMHEVKNDKVCSSNFAVVETFLKNSKKSTYTCLNHGMLDRALFKGLDEECVMGSNYRGG